MARAADRRLEGSLAAQPATRAGWMAAAVASYAMAAGAGWAVVTNLGGRPLATAAVAVLGIGYGWLGGGALRLAGWRRPAPRLAVSAEAITVEHPTLPEPVELPLAMVEAVAVDPRPRPERRVAATVRRNAIAPPTFLDARIPVISESPTAHSRHGAAAAPNLAVLLRGPMTLGAPPLAVRLLLRLATGRSGQYAGPRPGRSIEGLRLVVDDEAIGPLAARFERHGRVAELARDRRYLAPVKAADRRRARREQLTMAAVVAGVLAVLAVAALVGG